LSLPVINAFWVGPKLGPVSRACLYSFVRAGHRVRLHVYENPSDVPYGVELADAAELMPKSMAMAHKETGSFALAADFFRYEVQAAEIGVYVDCDCYCLQPLEDAEYIMGWENQTQ
jgi:hypothetical protein